MPKTAPTTGPGSENTNGQRVVRATGAASTTRAGQSIYKLLCGRCGFEYGANGIDLHHRRCPKCQGGEAGEPLTEPGLRLFD